MKSDLIRTLTESFEGHAQQKNFLVVVTKADAPARRQTILLTSAKWSQSATAVTKA